MTLYLDSAAMPLLQICSLNKSFGDRQVLRDFNCSIMAGEIVSFAGPSGHGKTTLLRIIMSLQEPDSGKLRWCGHPRISAVFQEDRLCANLSALANCLLVVSDEERRSSVSETLKQLGLASHEQQPVGELSGGQQRRVALARALVSDYDLLILDEPFKGLDPETKDDVIAYTKANVANKTVILVTHDKLEAKAMDARIIELTESSS
ncbi:MAG: ATP-binding cassette domain-containing protein [Coriobacteriales bacterium]|jgi:NitT/TauT family transport system ATP-binding protein|nr:ATP-binding cassette domain-containing protein [Coriobacteriales bacterium]